jgi:purine-binding chemotaxis protein CheW
MSSTQQFCTFLLDGHTFGVPVPQVQEVIQFQEMTPVPLAPQVIAGMINLRGQIVTAIDLRRRLGMKTRAEDRRPINVVVRCEDGAVSLLVDEIGDVIEVDEESFEPPPETMNSTAGQLIRGVHKLPERLLLVLDTERAVDVNEAAIGRQTQAPVARSGKHLSAAN